jgi:hypothetical protein
MISGGKASMRSFQGQRHKQLRSAVYTIPIAVLLVVASIVPAYAKHMLGGGGGSGGMNGITGFGTGTGSVACSGSSCGETASGKFAGTRTGRGSFDVTLNFSDANPIANGSGGSCYGASGTITITAASGDTVTLGEVGLFCEVGSGSAPTTFNGSYIVESGTGTFGSSTGAGTIVLATDASGNAYLSLSGGMGSGMNGGGGMGGGMSGGMGSAN